MLITNAKQKNHSVEVKPMLCSKVRKECERSKAEDRLNLGEKAETVIVAFAAMSEGEHVSVESIQHGFLINGMIDQKSKQVPDM